MFPGRVGAVVAGVRSSQRRSQVGHGRRSVYNADRISIPRGGRALVEDASVRVVEYQAPGASPRQGPLRNVTLPRCFRKGREELYAVRRVTLLEHAAVEEARNAIQMAAAHGSQLESHLLSEDQKSEASTKDSSTNGVATKLSTPPEPFAKYLSQKLGVQVTSVWYPDHESGGKYREFQPELGSLPFVDGMALIVCVDGEERNPDFVPPTHLPGQSSSSCTGFCGLMQLLRGRR